MTKTPNEIARDIYTFWDSNDECTIEMLSSFILNEITQAIAKERAAQFTPSTIIALLDQLDEAEAALKMACDCNDFDCVCSEYFKKQEVKK
jgi:hypothetical protein